jgi:hypothetical protein
MTSQARVNRARSMARLIGRRLSNRGASWVLVADIADAEAAHVAGEGRPFGEVESELFTIFEASGDIPRWLRPHYQTWRDAKDGKAPRDEAAS